MKRLVLIVALLVGLTAFGARQSRADTVEVNGYCFDTTNTTLISCTPTPGGSPSPTATPVPPVKLLAVSGPTPGPYQTTSFLVGITSKLTCFALPEKTAIYALGPSGEASFTELFPTPGIAGPSIEVFPSQNPNEAGYGTARVLLEVKNQALSPGGLTVKAVWPVENVERLQPVVPPATPTATATPYPGQATNTPTPSPTSTPTPTPSPSPSPTPTGTLTPTATPVPAAPPVLTVRVCIQPTILKGHTLGGDTAQLNGLTAPGATCSASVLYLDATVPSADQFNGAPIPADANGVVSYRLTEDSGAGGGLAAIRCTLGNQSAIGCTGFLILQSTDKLTADQQLDLLNQIQGMVATDQSCSSTFASLLG
jgi:hypothetical protein